MLTQDLCRGITCSHRTSVEKLHAYTGLLYRNYIPTQDLCRGITSLPNPSSLAMTPEFTRPLTEMGTRSRKGMFLGGRARTARKAANLTAVCEQNI
jgi:hypothetical protein